MKRDMELARNILLALEELEHGKLLDARSCGLGATEYVAFHMQLLKEAGYIEATLEPKGPRPPNVAWGIRLTHEGCELLDQIRPVRAWEQVTHVIRSKGAEVSLEALKAAAAGVMTAALSF